MTSERKLEAELEELARELPSHEPSAARRDAMRVALLEAARAAPQRRAGPSRAGARLGAAAAALCAAGLLLWWAARPRAERRWTRATIQSSSGARFEHTRVERLAGASTGPSVDEVVRLRDGRVAMTVEHLSRDERFRVVTGDAEVEVRGTTFDVVADADHLIEVTVTSGVVDVRPRGRQPVALEAGQRWGADDPIAQPTTAGGLAGSSPATTAAAPPSTAREAARPSRAGSSSMGPPFFAPYPTPPQDSTLPSSVGSASRPAAREPGRSARAGADTSSAGPSPTASPTSSPSPSPSPSPTPTSTSTPADPGAPLQRQATASEVAFGQGFHAVRQGNYGEAVALFELAIRLAPASALAADARFWLAVARARGAAGDGRAALADFLARHPDHPRAGEAAAMLGWILLEAGDRAGAIRRFRAAVDDRDPDVRASARKGLAAAR